MSVALWRIATAGPGVAATDMSGSGAAIAGGRWNSRGIPACYACASVALACLETLVHLNSGSLPLKRYLVRIDVPDKVWAARRSLASPDLPAGWDSLPAGKASMRIGDRWLADGKSLLMQVPSVVAPEEFNVLVNPKHGALGKLAVRIERAWSYHARLLTG